MLQINQAIITEALNAVFKAYGSETAKTIERIYRMETGHFQSRQFYATGSPGMEKHGKYFPYGWKSLIDFWAENPEYAPEGEIEFNEGKGLLNGNEKRKSFLVFPTVKAAMFSLAEYLKKYRPGHWFAGKDTLKAELYEAELKKIRTRLI